MTTLRPIAFCGPSGSGKTTLLGRIISEYPHRFAFSVSYTTRKPRPGEVNGKDYHFVERQHIQKKIDNLEFLEYAEFAGNIYGTSKNAILEVLQSGRVCLLDVDIQGILSLKATSLNPICVFIKPPCIASLERRLRLRGTETEELLNHRLESAKVLLAYVNAQPDLFDYVIVNDDLEVTYEILKAKLIGNTMF